VPDANGRNLQHAIENRLWRTAQGGNGKNKGAKAEANLHKKPSPERIKLKKIGMGHAREDKGV